MTVAPWSPIGPETITLSPGRALATDKRARGCTSPMPLVLMKHPSALPRCTTLVSPVTIWVPAAPAAPAMAATMRRSSANEKPSSMMKPAERAKGSAAQAARSLTVPFTARSPIHPPGKKSGETTKESVVKASSWLPAPAALKTALSPRGSSRGLWNASRNIASTRVWVALPPAPCESVTLSSLTVGLRRPERGWPGPSVILAPLSSPRRGPACRSCNTRRRHPRSTPCKCRWAFRVCTLCRTLCTARAG